MTAETDQRDLEWLVDRRSKIHRLLLKLYSLSKEELNLDSSRELEFQLLMATGFALWRATFLARGERQWNAIREDSRTFLETLVRDNAIAYAQDRDSKSWTFGYYVNDAYLRLDYYKRFRELGASHTARIASYLDKQSTRQQSEYDAPLAWDHAYEAANAAVIAFASRN